MIIKEVHEELLLHAIDTTAPAFEATTTTTATTHTSRFSNLLYAHGLILIELNWMNE